MNALIDHLWQSTLFGTAVWSITLALRHDGAALRHSLWLAASLKFLVPFAALRGLGAMAGWFSPAPEFASPPITFAAQAAAYLELAAPLLSPGSATSPAGGFAGLSIIGGVMGVAWLGGIVVLAGRWWREWRAAEALIGAARPMPGAPPDIRLVDAAIAPSAARVFRPVVLLPAALPGSLTRRELAAVVEHEREHIERRDLLAAHLHRLGETLFWFHPMVWWIGRKLVDERERACDEAVLSRGHDRGTYAEGILAVCRQCRHAPHATASALSGDLVNRIHGIIASPPPRAPGLVKSMTLVGAALCAIAVPLVAGAIEDSTRRQARLANDSAIFRSARITIAPATDGRERIALRVTRDAVVVRNTSLRELVALTYGVNASQVDGGGAWLDSPRYDVRAELDAGGIDPDTFDPGALRGAVLALLAERFDLQVHVNQRCQQPCGRRALLATLGPTRGS